MNGSDGGNPNRKARRAAQAAGELDVKAFMEMADKFIDLANRENRKTKATDLHMAFLYAASRYNSFVGKRILETEDQEAFVQQLGKEYMEMLRNHLADPEL